MEGVSHLPGETTELLDAGRRVPQATRRGHGARAAGEIFSELGRDLLSESALHGFESGDGQLAAIDRGLECGATLFR